MALRRKPNEAELLERIAGGDELAFSELFYAYYNQIGEFVQLLTHSAAVTEEIVQDVFTKIWVDRASLSGIRRFEAYLFVLSRNHTLNHIRRLATERRRKDEYARQVEADLHTQEPEREEYFQLVDRAVQLLPPQQQKVFALRRNGVKNPEIAQQMHLSIESVKKYQHLAMKFIVEFVKGHVLLMIIQSHSHSNWFS
ncbi:RNA polymerase sigma factor [Parapedobacter lycopersici]|uniref:RNA polymerase sigma factor n=1 Tax=Parapedobacter lycopersici TaxID=1864939 RepID=UPI00214DCDF2|nr:sigma-70 family RNA polymerase sigma factor [Parapedobacter lycopersici]